MIMLKRLSLYTLCVLSLTATSCKSDFIDQSPVLNPNEEGIFSSEARLAAGIEGVYARAKNQYFLGADWNAFRGFNLSAQMRGIGGLYVAPQVKNQNYITVDLKASYDICRYFGVFLRLDNITDTDYVINRGYTMPGFTAMGGIKLSI